MKLSSQEEYGLRCLLLLARQPVGDSLTISEVGAAEVESWGGEVRLAEFSPGHSTTATIQKLAKGEGQ